MNRLSAEQRFSVYYAIVFGSIGSAYPFVALWMKDIGIPASMIGIIVAAPSVVMLATTLTLGRWADNLRDRRFAIIACNWVVLVAQLLLFLSTGMWLVFAVWLICGVVMYAKMPITDASALSLTRRNGSDYARVRVFGSIGYVLMLMVAGFAYERWGIGIFVYFLAAVNVVRVIFAYCLQPMPRQVTQDLSAPATQPNQVSGHNAYEQTGHNVFQNSLQNSGKEPGRNIDAAQDSGPRADANSPVIPISTVKSTAHAHRTTQSTTLYAPMILLTLGGAALINASHAMVNIYGILLWTEQGMSEWVASSAIALGVVVEVALMWWFKSLTQGVSARACLMFAALLGMVRWSLLAASPTVPIIFVAQALHGVTFGVTYLAGALFISRRVPEHEGARGQSMLATIGTACMALSIYGCGLLYDSEASGVYWAMAGICVIAILCLLSSYRFYDEAQSTSGPSTL